MIEEYTLTGSPSTPRSPNPDFENPANWTILAMADDGTGGDIWQFFDAGTDSGATWAENVSGWVEVSSDLINWQAAGAMMARTAVEPSIAGFALVTFTTTQAPAEPCWFLRYVVRTK